MNALAWIGVVLVAVSLGTLVASFFFPMKRLIRWLGPASALHGGSVDLLATSALQAEERAEDVAESSADPSDSADGGDGGGD